MWKLLGSVLAFLGTALVFMSQVSYEDATSNLASWVQAAGFREDSPIIGMPSADNAALIIGILLVVFGLLLMFWKRLFFRSQRAGKQSTNEEFLNKKLSMAWESEGLDDAARSDGVSTGVFFCFTQPDGVPQFIYSCQNGPPRSRNSSSRVCRNRLTITNYGNEPVFKISIPAELEIVIDDEGTGEPLGVRKELISMFPGGSESILPGEKIVLFLVNNSEEGYWFNIRLLGYVEGNLFDSESKVKIRYVWEGFQPLGMTLERGVKDDGKR